MGNTMHRFECQCGGYWTFGPDAEQVARSGELHIMSPFHHRAMARIKAAQRRETLQVLGVTPSQSPQQTRAPGPGGP